MGHQYRLSGVFAGFALVISPFVSSCDPQGGKPSQVQDEMLSAFSSSCHLGAWTQAAIQRANTVTSIYRTLLDKGSNCSEQIHASYFNAQAMRSETKELIQKSSTISSV